MRAVSIRNKRKAVTRTKDFEGGVAAIPALSDEARQALIEQTRAELHDLDRTVEESVERLRDVARG